jgi:CheY-like chemotaxis protein
MTMKRALVVDDSMSARLALRKLLEDQGLEVELAESGEEALDFLKHQLVDVIFMDHTMPGMDGLEAVSAIKSNPRTATIPVMMYTTKEGEVYVGQARALGAVAVLPKDVQAHQLFEMLSKLDLVKDRRVADRRSNDRRSNDRRSNDRRSNDRRVSDEPIPERRQMAADDLDVDLALDRQAIGTSVQTLVTRILEDQHASLRADILRSQKSFAKEVAAQMFREYDKRAAIEDEDDAPTEAVELREPRRNLMAMAASALLLVASFLGWQFKNQRDDLIAQVELLERTRVQAEFEQAQSFEVEAELHAVQEEKFELRKAAIEALLWAVNQGNEHALNEDAFNETLAFKLKSFVDQLREIGFAGEVRVTSHLGEFCLQPNEFGELVMAPPNTPVSECSELGHPLALSSYVSDRLSVPFAQLLRSEERGGIEFELVALDLADSTASNAYPTLDAPAQDWNDVAHRNNRVEIQILN